MRWKQRCASWKAAARQIEKREAHRASHLQIISLMGPCRKARPAP